MTHLSVAAYIALAIDRSSKTQREIAEAAGLKPNLLTMIRTGHAPVPLDRIGSLAAALGVPVHELLDCCVGAYHPEFYRLVVQHHPLAFLKPDEVGLVWSLRRFAAGGGFAPPSTYGYDEQFDDDEPEPGPSTAC